MVKSFIFLILISFLSCKGIKVVKLQQSNKKPIYHDFFRKNYDTKFKVKTPTGVDTSTIYKEVYSLGFNSKKYFRTDGYNSFFRFYVNGRVNSFTYNGDGEISFNPNKRGYRGICYVKDNKELLVRS